jgi:hypothetical protein
MKQCVLRRALPALLCLALALSLTACGGETGPPETEGGSGMTGALSGGKGNVSEPKDDPDDSEGLVLLRACMAEDDQLAGAVAYLGQRDPNDRSSMTDWLLENSGGLVSKLPFLLEIPPERVLGGESGKLYCIVPRDESTSLAVNRVIWRSLGNGVQPVADKVLYREEYAQPVLVFVNYEQWPDEPDTEINLVTGSGSELSWYPMIDEHGCPIVPIGEYGAPALMDFAVFGYTTGLDYPEGMEPEGDGWWLPPTNLGLADTVWACDDWLLELSYGNCDPDYAGIAKLHCRFEGNAGHTLLYHGVWRMEDDCLRLELSAGVGTSLSGSFPILISPSGDELYFQRSRSGEGMPFLMDDMDSAGLTLIYDWESK